MNIEPVTTFLQETSFYFELHFLKYDFCRRCLFHGVGLFIYFVFIHNWMGFMHSDFPGRGVPAQSRSSHTGSSRRSEGLWAEAAPQDVPSIPGMPVFGGFFDFWVRGMCTALLWQVHKSVQRQIPAPSQLPELKPETGSTSRTRICSRFNAAWQVYNGI